MALITQYAMLFVYLLLALQVADLITTPPVVFAGLCVLYLVIVANNLKFALRTKP